LLEGHTLGAMDNENVGEHQEFGLITPVYKALPKIEELFRLSITIFNNSNVEHSFICPEDLDISNLRVLFPRSKFIRFPSNDFNSVWSYSQLLTSPRFYRKFLIYKFILITQLDSIVVQKLDSNRFMEFDYVGAPWIDPFFIFSIGNKLILNDGRIRVPFNRKIEVGNGGLSLRRTKSLLKMTTRIQSKWFSMFGLGVNHGLNEDVVISYFSSKFGYSVPSKKVANEMFVEKSESGLWKSQMIIGYHALDKYNPDLEREIFDAYSFLLPPIIETLKLLALK